MGLEMNNADFHYENRQCQKEREVKENTTHCIDKDGAITSRTKARVYSKVNAGSPRSVSELQSAKSRRSSVPSQQASGKAVSPRTSSRRSSKATSKKEVTGRTRCYDQPPRIKRLPCVNKENWQRGNYVRDECGSGIVAEQFHFKQSRKIWCKTPLSMYQATIGELARKILCREKIVPRDVKSGPPCNICEYILPPCGGYYRKYECLRPCEEEYVKNKSGKKVYRDQVERYWEPCLMKDQKTQLDINSYAGHNVYLAKKMRRKHDSNVPCW